MHFWRSSSGPRALIEDGHAEGHRSQPEAVRMCTTRQRPLAGLLWRAPVVGVVRTSPVPTWRFWFQIGCYSWLDRDWSMDLAMR